MIKIFKIIGLTSVYFSSEVEAAKRITDGSACQLKLFKEDADAWRLLQMTENGDTEQVGGSIVFE